MKILIAHDGSACAEAALDDLTRAGLPDKAEALVLAVTEIWLPAQPHSSYEIVEEARSARDPADLQRIHVRHSPAVEEALGLAQVAQARLRTSFPHWVVEAEGTFGSPASEVLRLADEWAPDLIVAGSHGRTALGRFVLGSVSQKILTEATCSVRIARGRVEVEGSAPRLVIGLDGSDAADAAVAEVAARHWPAGTEVRVVVADEPLTPTVVGGLIAPVRHWVEEVNHEGQGLVQAIVHRAAVMLRAAGLTVSERVLEGDPKRVLVAEAEEFRADTIFLGSTGSGTRLERFLLGSVSSAIAARAHCSVEVVRRGSR
ncbi:MAG: universal stress protein [Pyrinomonadaceae bacterium]